MLAARFIPSPSTRPSPASPHHLRNLYENSLSGTVPPELAELSQLIGLCARGPRAALERAAAAIVAAARRGPGLAATG